MPTAISNGFRHPLGDGFLTELAGDADGWYVPIGASFDDLVALPTGASHHLGVDWNLDGPAWQPAHATSAPSLALVNDAAPKTSIR